MTQSTTVHKTPPRTARKRRGGMVVYIWKRNGWQRYNVPSDFPILSTGEK